MRINISILFVTAGIGVIGIILEKLLSKSGNESGAYITGLVGLLIGFLIVIGLLKTVIDKTMSVFMPI